MPLSRLFLSFPHSDFPFPNHLSQASCLYRRAGVSVLCLSQSQVSVVNGRTNGKVVRLGLPSKGRTADDTLELLKDWGFNVRQVNPRQYIAKIPQGCLREMIQKCEDGMGKERKRHERSIVAGSVGS